MTFSLIEEFGFNFSENPQHPQLDIAQAMLRLKEYSESAVTESYSTPLIFPQFHVLSADKWTKNSTLYSYESHKGKNSGLHSTGQYSFTQPYRIPLIEQHRVSDSNGLPASRIFGRMKDAKLIKNKETGKSHLAGLGEVADPQAIHELLSGIWLTGSLGSACDAAQCSICGASIRTQKDLETHPHRRGHFYRPAGRRDQEADSAGFCEADSSERGAQFCGTVIGAYRAQEYSKVIIPSDDESVVNNPNIASIPGGHFSNESLITPTSSLWIPMKKSSSSGISELGERYVDLVTGREIDASSIGLLSGIKLHEYIESGFSIQEEALAEEIHLPSMNLGQEVFQEETYEDSLVQEEPLIPEAVITKEALVYCGPHNSFPVNNAFEYKAALRFLGRYQGPGNKSQIKAYILRRGRKNNWANSPSSTPSNKETFKSMSTENEATCPYALKITIPLPSGTKSYELLPRESVQERASSLTTLEGLDDLLACLETTEETALRSLLIEAASGSEETMEVVITSENYAVLASVVELLAESLAPAEEVVTSETPLVETETTLVETIVPTIDSQILQQLESLQAQINLLTAAPLPVVEDKKPEYLASIHVSEALLGLPLSELSELESQTTESLQSLSTLLVGLAGRKVSTIETPAPIISQEDAHPDTLISEARVDNPLQGEQTLNEAVVAEEPTDVSTTPITPADLAKIRQSIGSLVPSSLRRDLRRG